MSLKWGLSHLPISYLLLHLLPKNFTLALNTSEYPQSFGVANSKELQPFEETPHFSGMANTLVGDFATGNENSVQASISKTLAKLGQTASEAVATPC